MFSYFVQAAMRLKERETLMGCGQGRGLYRRLFTHEHMLLMNRFGCAMVEMKEKKPMTYTLRINARNDIHLPADLLEQLNVGEDRIVKVEQRGNALILVPVDLEPRYSKEELEGLDRLHADQKKKGWVRLKSVKDIDSLLK